MSELFLSVLNMSLTASYVIIFVILIRLPLKKAPKFISYVIWGVVAFRLIIPFSFESMFSLMPRNTNAVPIPHDIIYQQSPRINSGIEAVDFFISEALPAPTIGASVNPLQIYTEIGSYIWVLGIIALLVYGIVSIFILKRQLKSAKLIEKNIFKAKNLRTPFVIGLIRPKIYLPVGLSVEERGYILLHEKTHIRRKDHIIKILAFLILSIHWFNPLVWIGFILMGTDMELSCDEQVLKEMNKDIKKPYANSLLSLAAGRHILNGSPLAFGEGNVKGRIKNILNYRKRSFWIIMSAVVAAAAVSIGLLTNPKEQEPMLNAEDSIYYELIQLVNEEVKYTISPLSGDNAQLAKDAITDYLLKSAAWPGINIRTLEECYLLRENYSDGTTSDYYVFLHDGKAVIQQGTEGRYSLIDDGLYEKLVKLLNSSKTTVEPAAPELSLEQTLGISVPELDYASDDIVIFHSYFGLFVYDLNALQIIRSIDLKPLNCHQLQGSNACDVSVSMDGNTVYLYPRESENMYIYTVSSHTLQEAPYQRMEERFDTVPIEDVIDSTKLGIYSYNAVSFDTGEYGYLHASGWTLGALSYVRGDKVYALFKNIENIKVTNIIDNIDEIKYFDKIGITIQLTENKNWIGNPTYSIIDETAAQVKYYDKLVKTDMIKGLGKCCCKEDIHLT